MRCPFCSDENTRVIDSRTFSDARAIRRRRECIKCLKRFTTYETIEAVGIVVLKKDNRREEFNKEKRGVEMTPRYFFIYIKYIDKFVYRIYNIDIGGL